MQKEIDIISVTFQQFFQFLLIQNLLNVEVCLEDFL